VEKARSITGRHGSMLSCHGHFPSAPASDRLAQPVDSTPERTPVRLIGRTLRSRFDIAELMPRAWFIGPLRVDPPM